MSTYYFETDSEFYVTRQIELYENGKILKYHKDYLEDEFGGLTEKPLDFEEFEAYKISKDEFEKIWQMPS